MSLWNIGSGATVATVAERTTLNIALPLANGVNATTQVISGQLPPGTRLEENTIKGTPFEVTRDTIFTAVIRATTDFDFEDRTIKVIVSGPDNVTWQTPEGDLAVGTNNTYYVLDNSIVDFQLVATDPDIPAGESIDYYIADGEGELPPGLSLSEDGRLTGIVEPLLSLELAAGDGSYDSSPYASNLFDWSIRSTNGFGSYYYDIQDYDYSVPVKNPKKLNRYYPFIVTATDGDNIVKREFRIYLVGDDYLRSDNTIMQAGTGVFTADNTYLRNPVWLTPSDLGYRRANNYVTLYLDVIQTDTLAGDVYYDLEDFNQDGTISRLPPGLKLDRQSGEIIGRIPYQPAITQEYDFTITATRFEGDLGTAEINGTFYEDTLLGATNFKIGKLDRSLDDGVDDLNELRTKSIRLNNRSYRVVNVDGESSEEYDIIFVDQSIGPNISLLLSKTAPIAQKHFFVQRLNETEKEKYTARTIRFSDDEAYKINDIYPYLEYRVEESKSLNIFINSDVLEIKVNDVYNLDDYAAYNGNIYKLASGDIIDGVPTSSHTIVSQKDGEGNTITDPQNNPIPFLDLTKWSLVDSSIRNLNQATQQLILKQELERMFPRGPSYISNAVVGGSNRPDIWSIRIPSTADSRNKETYIDRLFDNSNNSITVTLLKDNEDRIEINEPLERSLTEGRNIGIALFRRDNFVKSITVAEADEVVDFPSSTKQFKVNIIGEIDSAIQWITDSDLGIINANRSSTLYVQATSSVPDTRMIYRVVDGHLPNGLSMNLDGQIIGKARQFASEEGLGLTTFDSRETTYDGSAPGITSFDREFTFTVEARDRFNYSVTTKDFKLVVNAFDNTQFSNIYARPFLKVNQRNYFSDFISNSDIFPPEYIYRPDDPTFGIQNKIQMLVYAGIETKSIDEYIAATSLNHKKKRFKMGDIKKAIAQEPGTNETLYEVIYIEVNDPQAATKGKSPKFINIKTNNKITSDSIQYAVKDDNTNTANGGAELPIYGRETVKFVIPNNDELIIETREGLEFIDTEDEDFIITIRPSGEATVQLPISNSEPFRLRPQHTNTIKVDSNAVKVSNSKDNVRYISNIENMRSRIEDIGEKERLYLPLWMRTPQSSTYPEELDYTTAIPLVFCKPGTSDEILLNIKNSDFNPRLLDFEIDRYVIDQTTNNSDDQYILFANYQFNI